ncbi:MAG: CarD family transcriptional regulator [Lachnospiraceae bacterium]|nr:CarD family transcriptional regulator [Lachnospiraceae bacterium]
MFGKGDYVVCGSKGVCTVEDVTKLVMPGVDEKREYYVLKPVYNISTTVYIPVDAGKESMRGVLSAAEANSLIRRIDDIAPIAIANDKMLEQEYRGCMRTNQCEEWVRIIKTTRQRKMKRQEMGRKVTAVDAKYSRIAEDSLFGELAVALGIPKDKVPDYIQKEIGK